MEVCVGTATDHCSVIPYQVNELHRLYRIQRQLMSDLTSRDDEPVLMSNRRRSKQPRRALDLQLPADEYIVSADEDDEANGAELLELTLAVGGRSSAAGRRKNSSRRRQEQHGGSPVGGSSPFGSSDDCSGASLLSSSPSSAGYNSDDGPAAVFHAPPPCQRAMAAFDLGDGMVRQQAPWLMQCQQYLTLRMT
jgi:hypothetical protein